MTPQRASTDLVAELTAIAEAILPGHQADTRIEQADIACGGPAGTNESKVYSKIGTFIRDPGLDASPPEVMRTARQTLTKHGWRIIGEETIEGNPQLRFDNEEGAGGRLSYGPKEKSILIDAHTACLDNPEG
ncbi:MAG: hypothetical protein GEV11_05300 [Streptosporangiales bacterium]|nr:hypothetical protein [Streptosporangiales bacterium]